MEKLEEEDFSRRIIKEKKGIKNIEKMDFYQNTNI